MTSGEILAKAQAKVYIIKIGINSLQEKMVASWEYVSSSPQMGTGGSLINRSIVVVVVLQTVGLRWWFKILWISLDCSFSGMTITLW